MRREKMRKSDLGLVSTSVSESAIIYMENCKFAHHIAITRDYKQNSYSNAQKAPESPSRGEHKHRSLRG
jgi:hypothetical protein